ncbi:MAG: diaminopimelate epimerase [Bacteroidia bacterium]|nr:diaminopimelate epimerase [Bacteroidia bacterium]
MKQHFFKYQGTGNDFIIIDLRESNTILNPECIRQLCNRHFGIGADGLMTLKNHKIYDFEMEYYNSDGLMATMCGNGARCLVAYAENQGIIHDSCRFIAADGVHFANINGNHINIRMNDVDHISFIENDYFLNTGNPHVVRFVDNLQVTDIITEGRRIRFDKQFQPEGTNADFAELRNDVLFVRTYEKGVEDETLSCGTGAVAAAICSHKSGRVAGKKIKISTPGGNLLVSFEKTGDRYHTIYLEGPAIFVFEGDFEIIKQSIVVSPKS